MDCSCDSDFMLKIMPRVGNAIRQRYRENGVSDDIEIILGMDNAGGHGKNDVVEKYKRDLLRDYNVRIWHQQPRTPESNMLDLGVWMHVQSKVKEEHFGMRVHRDVLWKTMQDAWWKHMKQQALTNVYNRLLKVVALTIEARGCNRLVEKRRGKLMSVPSADEEAFVTGMDDLDLDVRNMDLNVDEYLNDDARLELFGPEGEEDEEWDRMEEDFI